jgi:hypothetical protein
MALRSTAAAVLLAARRIQISPMNQHSSWPITFGMKGSNYVCVYRLAVLYRMSQKELYNFESLYKFIQRTYTMF